MKVSAEEVKVMHIKRNNLRHNIGLCSECDQSKEDLGVTDDSLML